MFDLSPLSLNTKEYVDDWRAIVFYHPEVKEIAAELCTRYPHDMRPGNVTWGTFPDGWANVKFEPQETIINRHIVFIMSAHKMHGFLEQICLLIALCRQFAKSVTIVIPYFGPGTMERVVHEGELATAETIFKLISRPIPATCGGLPALVLIDIHDIRERFYPADNVTPKMLSAAELILPIVRRDKLTIVFPDEGAYKRFSNLTEGLPVITFAKKRSHESREMHLGSTYNMDAHGCDPWKRFVIWDDLVHTGGTLIECASALRRAAVNDDPEIRAFVTHAIFENDAHVRFSDSRGTTGISRFYVTNTIPEVAQKLRSTTGSIFTVLNIAPVIAPFVLQRILPDAPRGPNLAAVVYLSSNSPVKLAAVERAFKRHSRQESLLTVKAVHCESQVGQQPWGVSETCTGVLTRHTALREKVLCNLSKDESPLFYLISIENGLVPEDKTLEDHAFVIVERFERGTNGYSLLQVTTCCGTIGETFAHGYVAAHKHDTNLTFGAYLNQREDSKDWCDPTDWSKSHGGSDKTREDHLADAIYHCLVEDLE